MVAAGWPGASNASLESEVVGPVESALAKLPGACASQSRIADGHAEIVEWFVGLGVEVWAAAARSAVNGLKGRLPEEALFEIVRGGPRAALWIAVTGAGDAISASEFARSVVRRRLEPLPGVRGVTISGERTRARFIMVDPVAACRTGVTVEDITRALGGERPKPDAEVLASVVKRTGSAEVRLSEVAKLVVAAREPPSEEPVAIGIQIMHGVDASRVLTDVRAELKSIEGSASAAVALRELEHPPSTEPPEQTLFVLGPNESERARIARAIAIQWRASPTVIRRVDDGSPREEKKITLSRERAAALGVELPSIATSLRALLGGAEVSTSFGTIGGADGLPTIVRIDARAEDPDATLSLVCVSDRRGGSVSLAQVVEVGKGPAEAPIHRRDGERVAVVAFDLAAGRSRAEALELARGAAPDLPSGYALSLAAPSSP